MTIAKIQAIVEAVGNVAASCRGSGDEEPILLHGPTFAGNEWNYVKECIDTAWVSSAGSYVTDFERKLSEFTGAAHAVAVVNGTAALHVALQFAGVERDTEVLAPALTFVATANAVSYCGAIPHFCDVESATLGVDPAKVDAHLRQVAEIRADQCVNRQTGRRISAIVPMHTFGHCVSMSALMEVAARWNLPVIEDAAESLGSFYQGKHTGRFGRMGVLSFNGNKVITTGAGGAIVTDNQDLARRAKHITTTAKLAHAWEYVHDVVGYNYRMPNINAALGCAQLEQLPAFLRQKRALAARYIDAFERVPGIRVLREPAGTQSNYWLNTLILEKPDIEVRNEILAALNAAGLQSRPIWKPMHELEMYKHCPRMDLSVTADLAARVINVPSSASLA